MDDAGMIQVRSEKCIWPVKQISRNGVVIYMIEEDTKPVTTCK